MKKKDLGLWFGVILITIAALALPYFIHLSSPVLVMVWIMWLVFALGLAYFTQQGKAFIAFAREAKVELLKVVWPTRQETIQKTVIVTAMVVTTSLLLWCIDTSMMWVIAKITHLG